MQQKQEYYKKNREKIRERAKQRYSDKTKLDPLFIDRRKKYYKKNKSKIDLKNKEWYENNRDKKIAYEVEHKRKRRQTDPYFRLKGNLCKRLSKALKSRQKSGMAINDLGCSIEEFKLYLTNKFQPGMTWDNYGKWHIDHIRPLSSFDLSDISNIREACHYTNLQPLWAIDNIKKGGFKK